MYFFTPGQLHQWHPHQFSDQMESKLKTDLCATICSSFRDTGTLQRLAKFPRWPMSEVKLSAISKTYPNKPRYCMLWKSLTNSTAALSLTIVRHWPTQQQHFPSQLCVTKFLLPAVWAHSMCQFSFTTNSSLEIYFLTCAPYSYFNFIHFMLYRIVPGATPGCSWVVLEYQYQVQNLCTVDHWQISLCLWLDRILTLLE